MAQQEEQMEVDMDYEYTYVPDEPKEEELFQINELMTFLYQVRLFKSQRRRAYDFLKN